MLLLFGAFQGTRIESNIIRESGIWEKQSSCFFQAKTAATTLYRNLCFNLPRAGFNFNDGAAGGDEVHQNLIFNSCRETSDHGTSPPLFVVASKEGYCMMCYVVVHQMIPRVGSCVCFTAAHVHACAHALHVHMVWNIQPGPINSVRITHMI